MFRHSDISTEIDRKTFLYVAGALAISVITILAVLFKRPVSVMGYVIIVMMALMVLCCLAVLFGMISDYACIKDGKLIMHYMFKGAQIELTNIGKITFKDDVYHVFDKRGEEAGTINGLALGIDEILQELNRKSVNFE